MEGEWQYTLKYTSRFGTIQTCDKNILSLARQKWANGCLQICQVSQRGQSLRSHKFKVWNVSSSTSLYFSCTWMSSCSSFCLLLHSLTYSLLFVCWCLFSVEPEPHLSLRDIHLSYFYTFTLISYRYTYPFRIYIYLIRMGIYLLQIIYLERYIHKKSISYRYTSSRDTSTDMHISYTSIS